MGLCDFEEASLQQTNGEGQISQVLICEWAWGHGTVIVAEKRMFVFIDDDVLGAAGSGSVAKPANAAEKVVPLVSNPTIPCPATPNFSRREWRLPNLARPLTRAPLALSFGPEQAIMTTCGVAGISF